MTNGEKFKTAEERKVAYSQYCDDCAKNEEAVFCALDWIDAEYVVRLKPCPFCGGEAKSRKSNRVYYVFCTNCSMKTVDSTTPDGVIAAWNRRVK